MPRDAAVYAGAGSGGIVDAAAGTGGNVDVGAASDAGVNAAAGRLVPVPPVEERVRAAVAAGAPSWAAVARTARCSRAWASALGHRLGLALVDAGPARDAVLSVRVRPEAKEYIDKLAANAGITPSEQVRQLLAEAIRQRSAAARDGRGRGGK